jgi:PAS domain S-box-containing protein
MSSDATVSQLLPSNGGTGPGAEAAEYERQFREILEFCPAALLVVDEDGRLLFHNALLREILGYSKDELDLCDTRLHWHDLNQRARVIKELQDRGGQILNERVIWRTKKGSLIQDERRREDVEGLSLGRSRRVDRWNDVLIPTGTVDRQRDAT